MNFLKITNTIKNSRLGLSPEERKELIENSKKSDSKISLDSKEEKKNENKENENKIDNKSKLNTTTKKKKIVRAQTLNQLQLAPKQKKIYQRGETYEKKESKTDNKGRKKVKYQV